MHIWVRELGNTWAALVNQDDTPNQAVAFLSGSYSPVEMALPEIPKLLTAIVAAIGKWRAIMPYCALVLHCDHSIHHMLTTSKAALTATRYGKYQIELNGKDIETKPLTKAQNKLLDWFFPNKGYSQEEQKDIPELLLIRFSPLEKGLIWFTDGAQKGQQSAFAALQVTPELEIITKIQYQTEKGVTAQEAELLAVIAALKSTGLKEHCTIYTDSSYVVSSLQYHLLKWKRRGMITATGQPLQHIKDWKQILKILSKREGIGTETAIVWTPAHTEHTDFEAKGNDLADRAASEVLSINLMIMQTRFSSELTHTPYPMSNIIFHEQPSGEELEKWKSLGCYQRGKTWLHPNGKLCVTTSEILRYFTAWHSTLHLSATALLAGVQANHWNQNLYALAVQIIHNCLVCSTHIARRGPAVSPGSLPIPQGPGLEWHIDYTDMIEPVKGKR
ncbi:uncharacterized protein LOC115081989 [Rhinatrema bivittatum]|uniref:uncharacterized protein LOC115081989 n=1 Tax=Rhinatrema bivittatum TaxID=194408 RepID=UPI00112A1B46|nr:uncharacterized protein LOC115081989 [Rhinatrema bivittatum]